MKNSLWIIVTASSLLLFSFSGKGFPAAKAKADFSGNWKIDLQKSDKAGSAPPVIKLTQTPDSLFIERVSADGKSFVEKLSFDGKTFVSVTTSKRTKSGTAKWDAGGQSFTETARLGEVGDPEKTAFNVTEHWTLSGDGKEVTVETDLSKSDGASFAMTAVYDKQP